MQAGPREGPTWGSVISWGWWELFAVLQKLVRGSSCGSGCEKPSAPKPSGGMNPHAQPRPLLQDPPPNPRSGGLTASLGPSFCGNPTTGRDRTASSVPWSVDTWRLSCLHALRATSVLEASSHREALVVLSGDGA